jgi:hypothetical protein
MTHPTTQQIAGRPVQRPAGPPVAVETRTVKLACPPAERSWRHLAPRLRDVLGEAEPVRLICIDADDEQLVFDVALVETRRTPVWPSLLAAPEPPTSAPAGPPCGAPNVVVSLLPTGIRAEIGGFAGDATPATNLLAATCDHLITNPNAVTASDLYFAADNVGYLEGNLLCRFLLGQLDLGVGGHRRVGLVVEEPVQAAFGRNVLNAVNAMRTVAGIEVDPVVFTGRIRTESRYAEHGHATGAYGDLGALLDALEHVQDAGARSIGLVSSIDVPQPVREAYYRGEPIPNPWGSAEAILTHTATSYFPVTAAHSPLLLEVEHTCFGTLGDPRDGAELISSAFLCSMVRGLARAPALLPASRSPQAAGHGGGQRLTADQVRAVVMPESAVGNIPFFAALDRRIPLILVRGNQTAGGVTPARLGLAVDELGPARTLYTVASYMEAAGLLLALRDGIAPAALMRPIRGVEPVLLTRVERAAEAA